MSARTFNAAARLLGFMLTGLEPGDAYRVALVDESVVPTPLRAVIERGSAFEPSARFQTIRTSPVPCEKARKVLSHGASGARAFLRGCGHIQGSRDEGDNCCKLRRVLGHPRSC